MFFDSVIFSCPCDQCWYVELLWLFFSDLFWSKRHQLTRVARSSRSSHLVCWWHLFLVQFLHVFEHFYRWSYMLTQEFSLCFICIVSGGRVQRGSCSVWGRCSLHGGSLPLASPWCEAGELSTHIRSHPILVLQKIPTYVQLIQELHCWLSSSSMLYHGDELQDIQ